MMLAALPLLEPMQFLHLLHLFKALEVSLVARLARDHRATSCELGLGRRVILALVIKRTQYRPAIFDCEDIGNLAGQLCVLSAL